MGGGGRGPRRQHPRIALPIDEEDAFAWRRGSHNDVQKSKPPDADLLDRHDLRELSEDVRISRPLATDSHVQHDMEGPVERRALGAPSKALQIGRVPATSVPLLTGAGGV